MIPILYDKNETSFTSNGLGRLAECSRCIVTEERNGIYELEFDYPITGKHYSRLIDGFDDASGKTNKYVVGVIHDDRHDIQPFDIYSYSAPINGIVTFYGHHISYRLSKIIVSPFIAGSAADAMQCLSTYSVNSNPFTFWTDKVASADYGLRVPCDIRSLLCGSSGSILDIYGKGEYEFDKFTVKLYVNRGVDTNVTIRYGKNLSDIDKDVDTSDIYTAVAPYWMGGEDEVAYPPEIVVMPDELPLSYELLEDGRGNTITDGRNNNIELGVIEYDVLPIPLDMSSEFEELPSADELRAKAKSYIMRNKTWEANETIKVSFVALWQTPEYEDVAALQRVSLCDTVSVYYPELKVIAEKQEVIKVVYNVLLERYDSMELGDRRTTFGEMLTGAIEEQIADVATISMMQDAINKATEMITGGLGGYVVYRFNADGQPQEILIMDTPDIMTAVNVIRMNKNGIGFSRHGYNGPFETAWTIDGSFNANFITAGTISANLILGGVLKLGGAQNGNGILKLYDGSNNEIAVLDMYGLYLNGSKFYAENGRGPYDRISDDPNQTYMGHYKRAIQVNDGGLDLIQYQYNSGTIYGGTYQEFDPPLESVAGSISANLHGLIVEARNNPTYGGTYGTSRELILRGNTTSVSYNGEIRIGRVNTPAALAEDYPGDIRFGGDIRVQGGHILSFAYHSGNTSNYKSDGIPGEIYMGSSELDFRLKSSSDVRGAIMAFKHGSSAEYGILDLDQVTCTNLQVYSSKSRRVKNDDYGESLLYCYETPSPMFGDIGEGLIDDNGEIVIAFDAKFAETIDLETKYQVFIQKYGEGDCYVSERTPLYFKVVGTPGLSFGWEIKAKQFDSNNKRLDNPYLEAEYDPVGQRYSAYGEDAYNYINGLIEGRLIE